MATTGTDIKEMLGELDAGVFADKMSHEISQMAMAVVEHGKAGTLTIVLKMKQIGHHHQVALEHTMKSEKPTKRGKKIESDSTQTPMHVGRGGKLTIFPENQMELLEKNTPQRFHQDQE